MSSVLLPKLHEAIAELDEGISSSEVSGMQTIGFFDLSGSTALKHAKGHTVGTETALRFTAAASYVVAELHGVVVKELGDGVLCRFDDPLAGCKAALNLKVVADDLNMPASFGLTLGRVSKYQTSVGTEDILGDAVDRCARIQGIAYPGQILVDGPMHEVVKTHLKDFREVIIGRRFEAEAKGIGTIDLWEISLRDLGLIDKVITPLAIHSGGRLSISEKVHFMDQADSEIIEIGIGLTSFAKYITGQKPEEFQQPVRSFLKRGVTLRCYALDPNYEPGKLWVAEQGDDGYEQEAERARSLILTERKRCLRLGYKGKIEYYVYRRIPEFHCLGVDVADPMNGRFLFSPYLPGLSHAECPVYQVSELSDPALHHKYLAAVDVIRNNAEEVRS